MMPFARNSSSWASLVIAALVLTTILDPSPLTIAAEPIARTEPKRSSPTRVSVEKPAQGLSEWNRHRSAASREWNRAAARFQPACAASATGSAEAPRIRYVSASGSEDGDVSAATASESAETEENLHTESETSPLTSSLSVRQQLLHALQRQREATRDAPPSAIPGSLTIMNSPSVHSQHSARTPQPDAATQSAPLQHTEPSTHTPPEPSTAGHDFAATPAPPVNTAKSHIGLSRTWEADLQSPDPYVRDRAQRCLRLEMQLLKLRDSQAAATEHAVPRAQHMVPHAGPSVHDSTAENMHKHEHSDQAEPGGVSTSPTQPADHHETPDKHSDKHSSVDHSDDTADPTEAATSHSSHPLIMENIVVDGPIDRLGLANNLFATGEYPMALEMYQETTKSELTAQEHFWVEYQTANCLRRLGKPAEASQRYRKLGDHPEAGWLSQQARWWVETLEKIRILEKTLVDNAYDHHREIVEEVEHAARHVENSTAPSSTSPSPHEEVTQDEHAH